jgi:hypothetical protein
MCQISAKTTNISSTLSRSIPVMQREPAYLCRTEAPIADFRTRKECRRTSVWFEGLFSSAMVVLVVSGGCSWTCSDRDIHRLLELRVPCWLGSDDLCVVGLSFLLDVMMVSLWLLSSDSLSASSERILIGDLRASSSSASLSSISAIREPRRW